MKTLLNRRLWIGVCSLLFASPALAQEWGSLKGKFVLDGAPPAPGAVNADKDAAVCGLCKLVDEDLVVDPATKGIKNILVYLRTKDPAVHPDYEKLKGTKVVFDNKCCRFEPRVVGLTLDQTLVVGNPDGVGHNANGAPLNDTPFNPLLQPGQNYEHQFAKEQRLPVPIACNIHPWMKGYVLPRENPYFAVSATDGSFEIKNLPAGELEFQVWQEAAGYLVAKPEWMKGKLKGILTVTIAGGKTEDLGEVKVDPKLFKK